MFPDSEIAQNYKMGRTKLKYIIEFGMAPNIRKKISEELKGAVFSFSFDETTTVSKKKQLDGYVNYVTPDNKIVSGIYIGSRFLGHCDAADMLHHVCELFEDFKLDFKNLLALGMDGPNVNKKFFKLISAKADDDHNTGIVDKGSCPLHTVNNGFRAGLKELEFDLLQYVGDLVFFFELSPARRYFT
jgi:hypothetical protein